MVCFRRQPVQILHGDKRFAGTFANIVNRADVRMIQRRRRLRLPLKSRQRLRIRRHVIRQKFQRHKAVQPRIFRLVHHAHTAATKLFNNQVVGNGLARQRLRIGHGPAILWCAPRQVNEVVTPYRSLEAEILHAMFSRVNCE